MPVAIKKVISQEVDRVVSPVGVQAGQTAVEGLGQGLQQVGDTLQNFQDEIDEADAKSADAAYSDLIREQLYADETGFMYSQGGDAVNRRASFSEALENEQKRVLDDLSPKARHMAGSAMQARFQRALQSVDSHTSEQRNVYLDAAAEARITSTVQDAIFSPDATAQSIATSNQEIDDLAARNGWAPEVTALKKREAATSIHGGIIGRLETADPIAALEYLRTNKDQMDGGTVAKWEAALVPKAREFRGRRAGAAAARGRPDPSSFNWSKYAVGGAAARSDSFTGLNQEYASRVAMMLQAADAELGEGSLKITSAYRSVEKQRELWNAALIKYGSAAAARKWVAPPGKSRHNSGTAVDFAGKNGGLLRDANSREAKWIKANAARFGLDVPMEWEPWQVEMSGSRGGTATEPTEVSGGGIDALMQIKDPDERDAALREYELITGAQQAKATASRDAAATAAFDLIEGGGNVDDLPTEFRQHIGREAMSSLRTYQGKIASGQAIETDDETYVGLADMMANSPDEFMQADPMEWRDKLDDGDFEYFVKQRSDMIAGKRKTSNTGGVSVSTLRTAASTALKAAGLNDNPQAQASFETSLIRWSQENPEDAANPLKVNEKISQMLVPVTINSAGLKRSGWNPLWDSGKTKNAPVFSVDWDGKAVDPNDDLVPEDIRDGRLKINDTEVENETIEIFANGFVDRFGRAPSVQELVEGLIATGLYE